MNPPVKPRAVLFDLDGTFADTAPDMAAALNRVRAQHHLPPLPLATIRPYVSGGARGMVAVGFGLTPDDADFISRRDAFLHEYEQHICVATALFSGIDELVSVLEQQTIAWGIVTNKISRYTTPLTERLGLHRRTSCIVSGDTCARAKPHPDPLLHAARLLQVEPEACLYVGDDRRDIEAARAAGMLGVAALYGYLGLESSPSTWQAWASIQTPLALLDHIG